MNETMLLPDNLKQQIVEAILDFADKTLGKPIGEKVRTFLSQHAVVMDQRLDQAVHQALARFEEAYTEEDEDVTAELQQCTNLWAQPDVAQALLHLIACPGLLRSSEQFGVVGHFTDILPQRRNRTRVDRAVSYLLRLYIEEIWNFPETKDIRGIYAIQMQRMSADSVREQTVAVRTHLQQTTVMREDVRDALIQLTNQIEQRRLESHPQASTHVRLYHNLPQPDYTTFIERQREIERLQQSLSNNDRAWQIVLTGPDGSGKSVLALAIAHNYLQNYATLPPEQRFEAIVRVSFKEKYVYTQKTCNGGVAELSCRTLQDMYTAIAQTLEREDITCAADIRQIDANTLYETALNDLLKRLGTGHSYYQDALTLAQQLMESITHYQLYPDMHDHADRQTEILGRLNALARSSLNLSFDALCEQMIPATFEQEQDRLIQQALAAKRTLLILDHVGHVPDMNVKLFLRHLPAPTKVIVTTVSPEGWHTSAEIVYVGGMVQDEAEQLIVAEITKRDLVLDASQREHLFRLTGGMPLPIKLCLARLSGGESFESVTRWLMHATGDLTEYCIKGQFDLLRDLNPHAWRVLQVCTLFDNEAGASRDALGYVADISESARDTALALLQRLALIKRTSNDRFALLPVIQRYAGIALDSIKRREDVIGRWLAWFVDFARTYGLKDRNVQQVQLFAREYPNLRNAIRLCLKQSRWEALLQIAEDIWFYTYLVGLLGDARDILDAAISAAQHLDDNLREARAFRRYGEVLRLQSQNDKALLYLGEAERIAQQYNDEVGFAMATQIRSRVLQQQGLLGDAEQLVRSTMETAERLDHLELKVWAICRIFEFDERLDMLEQAEDWARQLGWTRALAWIKYQRGETLIERGEIEEAESFLERSLRMAESWNERRLIACNKYGLARVYAATGRLALARQFAEDACDIYARVGMRLEMEEVEQFLRDV